MVVEYLPFLMTLVCPAVGCRKLPLQRVLIRRNNLSRHCLTKFFTYNVGGITELFDAGCNAHKSWQLFEVTGFILKTKSTMVFRVDLSRPWRDANPCTHMHLVHFTTRGAKKVPPNFYMKNLIVFYFKNYHPSRTKITQKTTGLATSGNRKTLIRHACRGQRIKICRFSAILV